MFFVEGRYLRGNFKEKSYAVIGSPDGFKLPRPYVGKRADTLQRERQSRRIAIHIWVVVAIHIWVAVVTHIWVVVATHIWVMNLINE